MNFEASYARLRCGRGDREFATTRTVALAPDQTLKCSEIWTNHPLTAPGHCLGRNYLNNRRLFLKMRQVRGKVIIRYYVVGNLFYSAKKWVIPVSYLHGP